MFCVFTKCRSVLLFLCLFDCMSQASIFSLQAERIEGAIRYIEKQKKYDETRNKQKDLRTLYSNLARFRNLSNFAETRFLLVDIAGFSVRLYDGEKSLFHSRALVGHKATPTLTFQASIEKIVINPWWNIPKEIVLREVLPAIQENPEIFNKKDLTVFGLFDKRLVELPPNQVNWKAVSLDSFPFIIKQAPGPRNPLGKVKFGMRNAFSILLHGTPEYQLFQSDQRAVSHGCVRVENSMALALLLLEQNDPGRWTKKEIANLVSGKKETTVILKKKLPVYFGYWTAWADEDLKINFRKDIYGWDAEENRIGSLN